jgi:hypothetical protein
VFRKVDILVSVGSQIVFRFPLALSIRMLLVANAAKEVLWEFITDEAQEVPVSGIRSGSSFQYWRVDEAPPEILAMASRVQERLDRELEERGPRKPPLDQVTYGQLPSGYREKTLPKPLKPGEYNVLIFAEQGHGTSRFIVPVTEVGSGHTEGHA